MIPFTSYNYLYLVCSLSYSGTKNHYLINRTIEYQLLMCFYIIPVLRWDVFINHYHPAC
jgi:hypothetical protein